MQLATNFAAMRSIIFVVFERSRHVARPLLSLQQPVGQDRNNLVRIDYIAVLIDRADAVRIAIRNQPGRRTSPPLRRAGSPRCAARIGSGLIPGNEGLISPRISTYGIRLRKDPRDHAAARAIHCVDQKLVARRLDLRKIHERRQRLDVLRMKIRLSDRASVFRLGQRASRKLSIALMIEGLPEPP